VVGPWTSAFGVTTVPSPVSLSHGGEYGHTLYGDGGTAGLGYAGCVLSNPANQGRALCDTVLGRLSPRSSKGETDKDTVVYGNALVGELGRDHPGGGSLQMVPLKLADDDKLSLST
jgi:hypothetical protein